MTVAMVQKLIVFIPSLRYSRIFPYRPSQPESQALHVDVRAFRYLEKA